jgi:hypothetical protein
MNPKDNQIISDLGLTGLSEDQQMAMLATVYSTLNSRVGIKIADNLTEEQLDQFQKISETGDDAKAQEWLEANVPNYTQLVTEELEAVKKDIIANANDMLSTANE